MYPLFIFLLITQFRPRKITSNEIVYKFVAVVLTDYSVEPDMPEYGLVTKIIILPTKTSYFQLKKHVSTQFNYHFHAFEVVVR